eukprot:TRINITY_DN75610_c0_g1_i1.p1 TRINITY_DN75610_c0_g1~~TRINITY_DN75610_c0_g1_i1.p1  ORF type:complete len:276 (+),score=9.38 TRINITY_DN75610_c0_g1_i1:40-828(+)
MFAHVRSHASSVFSSHIQMEMIKLGSLLLLLLPTTLHSHWAPGPRGSSAFEATAPGNYPKDCRQVTLESEGGSLHVMSWHLHYNTNTTEFPRFYRTFVDHWRAFLAADVKCPWGPAAGEAEFKQICSLDDPPTGVLSSGDSFGPFSTPTKSFWVPAELGQKVLTWASLPEVRGSLDILLHPNSGCMAHDHSSFGRWVTLEDRQAPKINPMLFPCNIPGYGCSEPGYPCKCVHSLRESDAPEASCAGCHPEWAPPERDMILFS